ncbi:GAF domain-containing protein [Microbispora sp. NBC_01389]|uniref:GAF domain-containing protein n=1 Tax=Microbispora sp. NBC_01389 TaxID=2903584 RepID=UPI003245FC6F
MAVAPEDASRVPGPDAVLAAVLFAADRFLASAEPWETNIAEVLARLGTAAGVSRVYIFENHLDAHGRQCSGQRYEWVAEGITSQMDNPLLRGFDYVDVGWGRWAELLVRRDVMVGNTRDFPASERPELDAEDIKSIALVPIHVEGLWWGFIGFDECAAEREWLPNDVAALRAAADTLGAAIQRTRTERRLRAQQAQYRAVFEATGDGLVISDLDGRLVEANPAFHRMHAYSPGELAGTHPEAWTHPADLTIVTEFLSALPHTGAAIRVRHIRKDGTTFPVEVRADSVIFSGEPHTLTVVRDATDTANAMDLLQRRVAALARVASDMVVDQPLETTLRNAVATVVRASGGVAAAVHVMERDSDRLRFLATDGLPDGYEEGLRACWGLGVDSPAVSALREQRVEVIRGAPARTLARPRAKPIHRFLPHVDWDILVAVPLGAMGQMFGALHVYYLPHDEPADEELRFLVAFADQIAVAVENATLLAEGRQNAALLERQRLARELHDSVSQALFSMTLHARAAELAMEKQGIDGNGPLGRAVAQLRELTQGALAEMRALIFELRPGALAEEGLISAVRKQAAAIAAREGLPIVVVDETGERPVLDEEGEEHLYRIVLEALHNTVKHADAQRITVSVSRTESDLTVVVEDDGRGFDPAAAFPGHMGLGTMRERAARMGADLRIVSAAGAGTSVMVTAPITKQMETTSR